MIWTLCALATLETRTLNIEFNGSKSGQTTFTTNPDGSFSGSTNLQIASITITSKVDGKFEGGKLARYTAKSVQPQGTTELSYDGTTLNVLGAKTNKIPYNLEKNGATLGASLIPSMFAYSIAKVKFDDPREQTVPTLLADIGSQIPLKFKPTGKKVSRAGVARSYDVQFGGIQTQLLSDEKGAVVAFDVPAQKLRWIAEGWGDLFADPMAKYPELSPVKFGVSAVRKESMRTRDGVELVSDVILPDQPGKYATILMRTPYGRASDAASVMWYVSRGYAVVAQDCRGRGDSSGDWDPMVNERKDGYDAVEWVAQQPWSDGSVGMIGGSYGGYVQWSAAVEKPPHLKCIVPQVSPPDAMRNLPYEYGVPFLLGGLWWLRIVETKNADMAAVRKPIEHPDAFEKLPLSKTDDALLGHDVALWNLWMSRPRKSDWKGYDFTDDIAKVQIPALHISGWWDGDGIGTKLNWAALRAAGKKNQWLIYGPWVHAFNTTHAFGDQEYGKGAMIDLDSVFLRFFDTYLKGKSVGWEKRPMVTAFATGSNEWRSMSDWPDAGSSRLDRLYFQAPNGAVAPKTFGSLTPKAAAGAKPATYTYDPSKEHVSRKEIQMGEGGSAKIDFTPTNPMVVFRTDVMKKPMTFGGPITVHLTFSTSARDTDFFGGVCDVDEKGVMRIVGLPGKVRASYEKDLDHPTALQPNATYAATIRPWDTMHTIKPGHRLAIFVCSSMFPSYARNLGLAEPPATATKMIPQRNTIYLDAKRPSYVEFQRYAR